MPTPFASFRHQAALAIPTGYRRWSRFTFSRAGLTAELEPISGSFTQDARRAGRWDGRLTFSGSELLPTRPGDLLTPFGTTVFAELGLELLDGSISYVPYGTYEISSCSTSTEAGSRVVDVGLVDISDRVERYRFETPYTTPGGIYLAQLINMVITNRLGVSPGVPNGASLIAAPRTFGLDTGSGPWTEILDVLDSYSETAWYDRVGDVQLGSVNADLSSSYPLDNGTSLSADFDTRPANVVVARGESQDDTLPVQAVAMDTDPGSPTYAGTGPGTSPYGRVTEYYASPLIITAIQAQRAADTILAGNVGAGATYTMTRPYDPTIDAGDVVSISGVTYVVDAITLDLAGDCSIKAREIR
jgi:hypothetical protein